MPEINPTFDPFASVCNQIALQQRLKAALQKGCLGHAYTLQGPDGSGKLAFAHALAQWVNAWVGEEVPLDHKLGRQFSNLQHPDYHWVYPIYTKREGGERQTSEDFLPVFRKAFLENQYLSPAGWSNLLDAENKQLFISVEEIRQLRRKITLKAFGARMKVIVIWQANLLNQEAANAFLKVLEEPPDNTLILLIVNGGTTLLPTIASRCQSLRFAPLKEPEIEAYLTEKCQIDSLKASEAARLAQGNLSNAIEIARTAEAPFKDWYEKWMRLCFAGRVAKLSEWTESLTKESREFQKLFINYALQRTREAVLANLELSTLAPSPAAERSFTENFSKAVPQDAYPEVARELEDALVHLGRNANPNMLFLCLSLRIHRYIGPRKTA